MNTRRARVVTLISGVAFAVVALAAPAAAADSNERWLGTIAGGIELYERCAGDEPILYIEGHSSSSSMEIVIYRLDHTAVGGISTATYAPTSLRVPAGDYTAKFGYGSGDYGEPITVRPCPFPGTTPPQPAPTVEVSIAKVSPGGTYRGFRVTVDNRKVTTSVRIAITWRDWRGANTEVFTVAPDKLVTKGTWRAKVGTVIEVQDRTHKELLARTRR